MRLPLRYFRNRVDTLLRWDFSITKMMSAHSICSGESCCSETAFNPAESVSTSGHVEKMCSAVGLRSLLAPQMKRRCFMKRFYREPFVCPCTHHTLRCRASTRPTRFGVCDKVWVISSRPMMEKTVTRVLSRTGAVDLISRLLPLLRAVYCQSKSALKTRLVVRL
jgi:hypothetical protein